MQTLTQTQFQAAFAHGAVQSVALEPVGSQFAVKVTTLTGEASLVQARGTQARLFSTTDAALKLLHKLGVRRIVLDLSGTSVTYEPGDSLGVVVRNDPALVDACLTRLNATGDDALREALSAERDIARPLDRTLDLLAGAATRDAHRAQGDGAKAGIV